MRKKTLSLMTRMINRREQFGKQQGRTSQRSLPPWYAQRPQGQVQRPSDNLVNGVFLYPETSFTKANIRRRSICLTVFLYSLYMLCTQISLQFRIYTTPAPTHHPRELSFQLLLDQPATHPTNTPTQIFYFLCIYFAIICCASEQWSITSLHPNQTDSAERA